MEQKLKSNNRGITLIALIITIIVLLILAVVAISAIKGDGIIAHAQNAKTQYSEAQDNEQILLALTEWKIVEAQETKTFEKFMQEKFGEDNITTVNENEVIVTMESGKKYNVTIDGTITEPKELAPFDASTLTIGSATNTDKYGWKVPGYAVTTTEFTTGVWRLFYQDSEYTYLITDELVGSYKPSDQYSNYINGSTVSQVGQRLSQTITAFFTENNTNTNIKATAWLTDTQCWKDYANYDAVFAIASPTAELFGASYNATNQGHTMTLGKGTYGYTQNTSDGWLIKNANHGIYNNSIDSYWWLASPGAQRKFLLNGEQ